MNQEPQNDHWFQSRLIWLRDSQPERLRELAQSPAELVEMVDEVVQQARGAWGKLLDLKMDPETAREQVFEEILTPPILEQPEFPMSETEWQEIEGMVNSAHSENVD